MAFLDSFFIFCTDVTTLLSEPNLLQGDDTIRGQDILLKNIVHPGQSSRNLLTARSESSRSSLAAYQEETDIGCLVLY